jgi:glycosyltransferase involved in cell wall biosynthesis
MSAAHVAVDVKNLALFGGGIAAFLRPLLGAWLAHRPDVRFSLLGPPFDAAFLAGHRNYRHVEVPWPLWLPRWLRHPVYDNVLFPRAVAALSPTLVFSPYHDVRLPAAGSATRAVMMIHDTCIDELGAVYPWRIRAYYMRMLAINLARAAHILTVSECSRERILARFGVAPENVSVVYNTIEAQFAADARCAAASGAVRARYGSARLVLYAGGSEYRKNVARLCEAMRLLAERGEDIHFLITGAMDAGWKRALGSRGRPPSRAHFLGQLDAEALKLHYLACDAVVYPTLCEGFGRVCLEAMTLGTPLACSDLAVLREVAGGYPEYFDPTDAAAIAEATVRAIARGRQPPRRDERFAPGPVGDRFTALMDRLLAHA